LEGPISFKRWRWRMRDNNNIMNAVMGSGSERKTIRNKKTTKKKQEAVQSSKRGI